MVANGTEADIRAARMRLRDLHHWVARHVNDTRHERRVMRIAAALFDLTGDLHHLGPRERRLLKAGALLHDVGRCRGSERHHIRGARMVLASRNLRLHEHARSSLAYLVRYHRGRVPERRRDAVVAPAHHHETMRLLLAMLRCADAFDSRRLPSPTLVLRRRDDALQIHCYVDADPQLARRAFDRRKKYRLLEKMLGLPVRVKVRRAEELGGVPRRDFAGIVR